MLKIKKYAAIDIGSNAVRMLISNVIIFNEDSVVFNKNELIRVPIRLGKDVFAKGKISKRNIKRLTKTMEAFSLLMQAHKAIKYKACATSAMREAKNGKAIIKKVLDKTGVEIEIIDGEIEATIIAETDLQTFIDPTKTYLYVDVGGGSTELTIYHHGEQAQSKSFKTGTVRLLSDKVDRNTWVEMEQWVKKHSHSYQKPIQIIGSGGNINKIFKMSGKLIGTPLTYKYLKQLFVELQEYSYEERIIKLGLNPDRADVIIPATRIYLMAMKWSDAKYLYVPKIGLADGIIKCLHHEKIEGKAIEN